MSDADSSGAEGAGRSTIERWGKTPRTTTQSKSTMWDQTPAGRRRISEVGPARPHAEIERLSLWDVKPETLLQKPEKPASLELTDSEILRLLPKEGFSTFSFSADHGASDLGSSHESPTESSKRVKRMIEISKDFPIKEEDVLFFHAVAEDNREVDELEKDTLRALLLVKNGQAGERKTGMRALLKACAVDPELVLEKATSLLMCDIRAPDEKYNVLKGLKALILAHPEPAERFCYEILLICAFSLGDENYFLKLSARRTVLAVSSVMSLNTILLSIRDDLNTDDPAMRGALARLLGAVACSIGVPKLVPFLEALGKSTCHNTKLLFFRTVSEIAFYCGKPLFRHLSFFSSLLRPALSADSEDLAPLPLYVSRPGLDPARSSAEASMREEARIRMASAASAVSSLARASAPHGGRELEDVTGLVFVRLKEARGKPLYKLLKAAAALTIIAEEPSKSVYCKEVLARLHFLVKTVGKEAARALVSALCDLLCAGSPEAALFVKNNAGLFFSEKAIAEERQRAATKLVLIEAGKRANLAEVLIPYLKDSDYEIRRLAVEVFASTRPPLGLKDREQMLSNLRTPLSMYDKEAVANIKLLLEGTESDAFVREMALAALDSLSDKSPAIRARSASLLFHLSDMSSDKKLLSRIGSILYENMAESCPDALEHILRATCAVYARAAEHAYPRPPDIVPSLLPVLKSGGEGVKTAAILFLTSLCRTYCADVAAKEWIRISYEVVDSLGSRSWRLRREAAACLGEIARGIGPQDVVSILVSDLKLPERERRISTSVALAVIADCCGIFTVLPSLVAEYAFPSTHAKSGVLKTIRFVFEHCKERGRDYAYAVVPVLEDALKDRDVVHRQLACQVVRHLCLSLRGPSVDIELVVHLLNLVFPNIFDEVLHISRSYLECIEAVALRAGPAVLYKYIAQGLFHPAKKVREKYTEIYSILLLGSPASLIPCFNREDGSCMDFAV